MTKITNLNDNFDYLNKIMLEPSKKVSEIIDDYIGKLEELKMSDTEIAKGVALMLGNPLVVRGLAWPVVKFMEATLLIVMQNKIDFMTED